VSDRSVWVERWCPQCRAAPGARCREWRWGRGPGVRSVPLPSLHIARSWFDRPCPPCRACGGEPCRTPSGREASQVHTARLRPGRSELAWWLDLIAELECRGAAIAVVPFSGRAGRGGETGVIQLSRLEDERLINVERWTSRDELCYALEAPVWDRFESFAGQGSISGDVIWTVGDRRVVIAGRRGGRPFEEVVR
jgi:hypothetical protein